MRLHVGPVLLVLAVASTDAQAPKPPIIDLATAYVHRFVDAFSNVVAEERYTQEVPRQRRTLRSDFLLVRYPGATRWQAFRDVLEVDGKRVQEERQGRLARLFLEPPENAMRRIDEIARTSARYNLRDIGTLNSPLHVLFILQVDYRDRFRFSVAELDRSLGPTVRIVRFEESARPTLIRSNFNDRPSRGFVLDRRADGPGCEDRAADRATNGELISDHDHNAFRIQRGIRDRCAARDARLVSA